MTPNAQSPSRHVTTRVVSRTKPAATKLNIFRIERRNLPLLEAKLRSSGLVQESTNSEHGWETSFWFSELAPPVPFRWLELYADLVSGDYRNQHHLGVYVLHHADECFVLSHGTAHFSVRPFADPYFGIEMAKRIANEKDVQKRASRGYAGRKRKEVASFTPQSPLMIRSGDSVDLLSARIAGPYQVTFGKSATFGGSMQITLKIDRHGIPAVCDAIVKTLAESEAFPLPTVVKLGEIEAEGYDEILISDIMSPDGTAELVGQGFEIVGVDILFAESESYRIKAKKCKAVEAASIDRETIQRYIKDNGIPPSEILDIRIEVETEGSTSRTRSLKRSLDFVVPNENVALVDGRWMRFNEDYVKMLNRAVDHIAIDPTERAFELITVGEPTFNKSAEVKKAGYANADRNFGLIDIGAGVPIEAYDLEKGDTVYAVKRGTPQKLGYVVDQAIGVLEIIRNNADTAGFETPKVYCLWLIFNRTTTVDRLSDVDSIILKQKVEIWAQQCMELGITPKLKFSRYPGSTRRRLKAAG